MERSRSNIEIKHELAVKKIACHSFTKWCLPFCAATYVEGLKMESDDFYFSCQIFLLGSGMMVF